MRNVAEFAVGTRTTVSYLRSVVERTAQCMEKRQDHADTKSGPIRCCLTVTVRDTSFTPEAEFRSCSAIDRDREVDHRQRMNAPMPLGLTPVYISMRCRWSSV
jgi:hypothetical protein